MVLARLPSTIWVLGFAVVAVLVLRELFIRIFSGGRRR